MPKGKVCIATLRKEFEIHFKTEINVKRENWRSVGFMSSLSKDKKLTWFVEVFIAKKVWKVHAN